jgi:hypothetical protein
MIWCPGVRRYKISSFLCFVHKLQYVHAEFKIVLVPLLCLFLSNTSQINVRASHGPAFCLFCTIQVTVAVDDVELFFSAFGVKILRTLSSCSLAENKL